MKIKAVIVDDERNARTVLRAKLTELFPQLEILLDSDDLNLCKKVINEKKPEIVFLDIQMPEMDGFEFLKRLDGYQGEVVFVTAYNQFAIQAFKALAFGYLLKPVSNQLLTELIDKLKTNLEKNDDFQKRFEELLLIRERGLKKIAVPVANGYKFLRLDDIIRLKGASKYTVIYSQNSKVISTKNIGYFIDCLPPDQFFLTHKSHAVNVAYVSDYCVDGEILLENEESVPLSRRRKTAFFDFFSKF